jgi:purine-binding chemotaxis protein CheW
MADNTTGQIVVFSLGKEEYALPINRVQEIIRYTEPRAVASDAHWIRGVISLRGKIVPVCDLGAHLGLPTEKGSEGNIVIVEAGSSTAGIIVDDVDEVLTVDEDQLEPVPAAGSQSMQSIAKIDERLVVLLNIDAMFGGVDLHAGEAVEDDVPVAA